MQINFQFTFISITVWCFWQSVDASHIHQCVFASASCLLPAHPGLPGCETMKWLISILLGCQYHYYNAHLQMMTLLLMVALCNRADHNIFILQFLSIFYLPLFFSSPNLSGRRLDVYHTSTHGVALERIQNAGLKPAARSSLQIQDAKKSPKIVIWAPSHNFVGLYLRK